MKFVTLIVILVVLALAFFVFLRSTVEAPTEQNMYKVLTYWTKVTNDELVPVEIEIGWGSYIERRTLEELLKGTQAHNLSRQYGSTINEGVKIQSFRIENKIAYVDFNEELEKGVAGSAMVLMIREQIEKTLTQFDTIESVIISINGRTEDILQP